MTKSVHGVCILSEVETVVLEPNKNILPLRIAFRGRLQYDSVYQ